MGDIPSSIAKVDDKSAPLSNKLTVDVKELPDHDVQGGDADIGDLFDSLEV